MTQWVKLLVILLVILLLTVNIAVDSSVMASSLAAKLRPSPSPISQTPNTNVNPNPNPSATSSITPNLATLPAQLAAERVAALPELKAKLLAKDKANDLTIIITPALLNQLLQTLQGQTFKFQNLFTLTIQSGQTQLYNGLTLAQLQAELATTSALLTVKQTLAITARLVISSTTNQSTNLDQSRTATPETLTAKLQVVEIKPVVANATSDQTLPLTNPNPIAHTVTTTAIPTTTTTATAPSTAVLATPQSPNSTATTAPTLPPETLTALLPPLQLPLALDFNQIVQFEPIKQQKPLAFEATLEARQIAGKFEITALLPLENRLVLRAQIRDLRIKRASVVNGPTNPANTITPSQASLKTTALTSCSSPTSSLSLTTSPSSTFPTLLTIWPTSVITQPTLSIAWPNLSAILWPNHLHTAALSAAQFGPLTVTPTPVHRMMALHPATASRPHQWLAASPIAVISWTTPNNVLPRPATTLDQEIDQLAANLFSNKDLSLRLERRFLARLLNAYARASTQDLLIKLLPTRLFTSQSDLGFAQYENYLDIEMGQGSVDLRDADLELGENGRGQCLADLTGQFQGQARGRQLGISYTANPQVTVALKDQFPFLLEKTAQGYQLRPVNKAVTLHLKIMVPIPQLGTSLKLNREVVLQTSNLLRPFLLPIVYAAGLQLPDKRSLTLIDLDYLASQDQLWLGANLKISQP